MPPYANRIVMLHAQDMQHAFMRVLGFHQSYMPYWDAGIPFNSFYFTSNVNRRGSFGVKYLTTPYLKQATRDHYGCQTLVGMVIENNLPTDKNHNWE
jgi:hypothetical protein